MPVIAICFQPKPHIDTASGPFLQFEKKNQPVKKIAPKILGYTPLNHPKPSENPIWIISQKMEISQPF